MRQLEGEFPARDWRQPCRSYARRDLLSATAGLGVLGGLGILGRALADEADVPPSLVTLSAEIEPIVRRIEEAPRDRIVETAVKLFRSRVNYRQFMAALYLAGIRNVDARSSGSRFHCVYVVSAAHQLALESPAQERLLPLFWALDDFKGAQASRPRPMPPLEARAPSGADAITALREAVEGWDQPAAEVALAGMARTCGAAESFEELWRLGARDFRPIGHKAIFVANTWRTLQVIGWQHAEPAFRALGQSLAGYGPTAVAGGFAFDDQCFNKNDELARAMAHSLPVEWTNESAPGADSAFAADLLAPIRAGDASVACQAVVQLLTGGQAHASAIWDVAHLAAAEFMLNHRGIVAVHAVTSINALHFGFRMAQATKTRLMLLLQAVGWLAHFAKNFARSAPGASAGSILDLAQSTSAIPDDPDGAAEAVVAAISTAPNDAVRGAFAYACRHGDHPALFAAARRLVYTRGRDPHDFKFPAAAFEDVFAVSPAWRPHLTAASILHIPAPSAPETQVFQRARDAVADL